MSEGLHLGMKQEIMKPRDDLYSSSVDQSSFSVGLLVKTSKQLVE